MLDANKVRKDFPIFNKNSDLIYLDSGATSLKPQSVIDAMTEYYSEYSANIKRGIYTISERATEEYEKAREMVAKFIGAETNEVVFTRNASESLNLLMYSLGTNVVGKNDEVVVTMMEHHSNFVTWQQLCLNTGATFKIIEIGDDYHLDIFNKSNINLKQVITKKTKILALTHVSNVLGTVNPIKNIV
nr:aminotransferase class V-fold PLP-dependent enzyme [Candidatus Woesebacteria bacterium]